MTLRFLVTSQTFSLVAQFGQRVTSGKTPGGFQHFIVAEVIVLLGTVKVVQSVLY